MLKLTSEAMRQLFPRGFSGQFRQFLEGTVLPQFMQQFLLAPLSGAGNAPTDFGEFMSSGKALFQAPKEFASSFLNPALLELQRRLAEGASGPTPFGGAGQGTSALQGLMMRLQENPSELFGLAQSARSPFVAAPFRSAFQTGSTRGFENWLLNNPAQDPITLLSKLFGGSNIPNLGNFF